MIERKRVLDNNKAIIFTIQQLAQLSYIFGIKGVLSITVSGSTIVGEITPIRVEESVTFPIQYFST